MEMFVRWKIAVTLMAAFPAIISTAGSAGPLAAGEDGTSGRDSWPHPVHVYEEDNALITCVVRDVGNNTVIWKREDADTRRWRILTAGHDRVTPDKRIQILHDDGGDVWVLAIKDVKSNDSGVYACEVNSNPVVRTLHKLSVLSRNLQPPPTVLTDVDEVTYATMREHNYTDCCVASNVSTGCLGFCNIQSILDGNTGQDPEHCEADFPAIVRCMADMRNHVPCCIDEGVPDICQDVCRGEYTMITDNIKTHFSCSAYTEQTLACIVEGIEILPSAPLDIEVLPLTDKSLNISWMPPFDNSHTVTKYVVNVTMLKSFDPSSIDTQSAETSNNSSQSVITPHSVQVKVNKEEQSIVIDGLTPLTMYEVTVIAKNVHGSSLPSYPVRSLTLIPGQSRQKAGKAPPNLPDVRGCCYEKGVTHTTCLDKLCGMNSTVVAAVTDLMICAPWAEQTFSCLANGIDHRPCCRARGLPELCQELCSGNVTELNFNYFREILQYPHFFAQCDVQPPHILTSLKSDSLYEVYVTAVNDHGAGEPSQRVVFDTLSKLREREVEDSVNDYNVTECCIAAGLSNVCLPVCTYDASMSKMKELATVCAEELPKLIRCGAGGRNHRGCCSRRGVPDTCLPLCAGVVLESVIVTATNCIPYIGNIVQCFEEGTGVLPGPVEELHAVHVTENDVTIRWEPPKDSNVTDYVVHYKKVDNTSMHETSLKLDNQKNTTSTTFTITGLETNGLYNIFVVSRNTHGTSLPSSVLLVKATATNVTGKGIAGVTSPPHSLAVVVHSATYVTISWQPPEFSLPSEQITYKLFYKSGSENQFTMFETSVTTYILKNLTPNTQYIIYVIALSKKGASLPSETLIAWTDPAYPAFVEPPTVHPINLVVEGSSMTILCIAMGTPMPTISLYISGRLVRQEVTRHMVTVIYNVTRDMDHISCYADNGFGTPMEARRRIVISHMPHLTASGITMAAHGDTVSLECIVDAHPEPKMMFWRDYSSRKPVIRGPKYDVTTRRVQDEGDKWIMTLTIKQISDEDGGDYYCHAENAFGNATQPVSVRIRNVVNLCDISDGSDHRSCCANAGVERGCLDWCRGEPLFLQDNKFCLVSYTKTIMSCFREGRDKLPGPPQNVRVEHRDLHSVIIHWDIPVKNPHTVEMYRVFWRQSGVRTIPQKNDTKVTSLIVSGLKEGVVYECVVKAGNSMGTSHLTDPVKFTTDDKYITSSASLGDEHSQIGVAVGILLALVLVAGIVVAAVWFIRTRNLLGLKSNGNVAFENPSYLREVNMDHMQISQPGDVSTLANGNGSMANGTSTQHQQPAGWKHEPLHVPASTEVPPSLYEELKLGHDGVGFKRLKP
ncbi:Ig-like and fibronectin type-III domain-containing protein 2 [Nilaparvata lugens]|uniref:Ig-like and fibronectin type-III domain-containing protein 2 n=1 Tax=Nilaparvata lugens TaxID=108931 RepID=UPI00193E2AAA|nr:Ig-like and fibronectin type-III domain-containing protein 2 [Nilaparvata lugens]